MGPMAAGPWGLLQTLADGIKLFFKEDLLPDRADRLVFRLAPYLSVVPAFVTFAVVPIGGVFSGGQDGSIQIPFTDHAPTCSWPTRPSASCWCWPCPAWPSTA